ncbi:MAG: hypothetical protein U0M33_08235 [Lachnospiraceae bacterium]|nr:hypothetical protein [Lachnospiraceae bacterium]
MIKISLNGDDWKCKDYLGEDWVWRNGEKRETKDSMHWNAALVPGCVLYDMYRCGKIPDPHFEKNSLYAEWIPQRTWIYRKAFEVSKIPEDSNVRICFEGIDYDAKIFFNDCFWGDHHSMFTPISFDVTQLLERNGKNLLAVVLEPAPVEQPQVSRTRYVKTHKSRMTYWWDFCPRMIHVGIWDDVYLAITGKARILQPDIEVRLRDTFSCADLVVSVPVHCVDRGETEELMLKAEVFIGSDIVTSCVFMVKNIILSEIIFKFILTAKKKNQDTPQ